MDGRFEVRRAELLAQAQVSVEDWDGVTERLERFVEPFVESLTESAQRRHFVEYASGLLSNLEQKTSEGIAYLRSSRSQADAAVHRRVAVGASAVVDRTGAAGVPDDVKFQTRHEQALEMLDDCGALLPHRWITGDDEMG